MVCKQAYHWLEVKPDRTGVIFLALPHLIELNNLFFVDIYLWADSE